MIYLVFTMQIVMVLLVLFFYLSNQNRLSNRNEDASTQFTKEDLINWQNTLATMLQETETFSKELTEKITKHVAELDGKISIADEKIKEIKELVNLGSPSVQNFTAPVKTFPRVEQMELPANPRHIKIFELADQGWNITDIAREAKVGKGEVQLILGLRREEKPS